MSDFIASAFISDLIQAPDKEAAKTLLEVGSGGATSLNDLTDVETFGVSSYQVLHYGPDNTWVPTYLRLKDCSDVSGTDSASEGQALVYRYGIWQPYAISDAGSTSLNDLSDVDLNVNGGPVGNHVLYYNGDFNLWVNKQLELNNLSNVAIADPVNGQVLKYSNGIWSAANESGGSGGGGSVVRPSDFFTGAAINGASVFGVKSAVSLNYSLSSYNDNLSSLLLCNLNYFNDAYTNADIFLPSVAQDGSYCDIGIYDCFGIYGLYFDNTSSVVGSASINRLTLDNTNIQTLGNNQPNFGFYNFSLAAGKFGADIVLASESDLNLNYVSLPYCSINSIDVSRVSGVINPAHWVITNTSQNEDYKNNSIPYFNELINKISPGVFGASLDFSGHRAQVSVVGSYINYLVNERNCTINIEVV